MFYRYEIRNNGKEDILYLYLTMNYEFSKELDSNEGNKIEENAEAFIKNNSIDFSGNKIYLVVDGIIVKTLEMDKQNETINIKNNNYSNNLFTINLKDKNNNLNLENTISEKEELIFLGSESGKTIGISNDEVRVRILHASTGGVKESDVTLASVSNAIIIGFNVRPEATAAEQARKEKVDLRLYSVIYDAIDAVETALKGMMPKKYKEVKYGTAEVRKIFKSR